MKDNYCTEIVDSSFLQSMEGLNTACTDILIIPDLNKLSISDFQHLKDFQDNGGALIMSASDLLMEDHKLGKGIGWRPNDDMRIAAYTKTAGKIGIRTMVSDVQPDHVHFDLDLLPFMMAETVEMMIPSAGAKFNTTSNVHDFFTVFGSYSPGRYEVTRNFEVAIGCDSFGRHLNVPVCFSQNWENGSRQCVFANNHPGSFFHPDNPYFEKMLKASVKFCENKVIIKKLQPNFACYHQGEHVDVAYTVRNVSDIKQCIRAEVIISDDQTVFKKSKEYLIPGKEEIRGEIFWMPDSFQSDSYLIRLNVYVNGSLVSKAENGFVVWNDEIVKNGPVLTTEGRFFKLNGHSEFLSGINYYDSNQSAGMWIRPNIAKLNRDLKDMADAGVRCVRIHYHPPKWFYDVYRGLGYLPEGYEDLGESYLPTEKYWRIFDAHVYLCQKYGIVFGGDLFTLRPREMGDFRGWMFMGDYFLLPEAVECQKEFLKQLVPRYRDVPGISWDIYNEPMDDHGGLPEYYRRVTAWAHALADFMRGLGDCHTINVGSLPDSAEYEEFADYLAPHAFCTHAGEISVNSKLPQYYQECWMMHHSFPDDEANRLDDMKFAMIESLRTGLAGFSPWQWTEQLAMWLDYNKFYSETMDNLNGSCVYFDGSLKISGQFYKDFSSQIGELTIMNYYNDTFVTEQGELFVKAVANTSAGECYLALKKAGRIVRGLAKNFYREDTFGITADRESDLWFSINNGYLTKLKPTKPCTITMETKNLPVKIILVNNENKLRKPIDFTVKGNMVRIDVKSWQVYYWLELQY